MSASDEFFGGVFTLFYGVVEDVLDPLQMGRARVRCFGFHTEDKTLIPTASLPWATPLMPVTSASMSGIGQSATGLLPGSWVVGFFRDGPSAQDPIILGSVPSRSTSAPADKGFSDPSGANPRFPGEIDTPKSARSDYRQHRAYTQKVDTRVEKVETAAPAKLESVSIPESDSYYSRNVWSLPDPASYIKPLYPWNSVTESQAGIVKEIDDTPSFVRIAESHPSGSSRTISNDGSEIVTVVGSRYVAVFSNDNLYIKGSCNITIDGDCRKLVKGNYHLEVEGNYTESIKGSKQKKIGLSSQTEIGQESAINISGKTIFRAGGDELKIVNGNADINIGGDVTSTIGGIFSDTVASARSTITGGSHTSASTGSLKIAASSIATSITSSISLNASSIATNVLLTIQS